MTIKINDLAKFTKKLKQKYKRNTITRKELRFEIAMTFGASRPTIADKMAILLEFGFIKPESPTAFKLSEEMITLYGK